MADPINLDLTNLNLSAQDNPPKYLPEMILLGCVGMVSLWVGWIGLAGADDFHYLEAAVQGTRSAHWHFRWPLVFLTQCIHSLWGVNELALLMPIILTYFSLVYGIAFIGLRGQSREYRIFGGLLAATLPIHPTFATTLVATPVAAMVGMIGAICFLEKRTSIRIIGSFLLALSFAIHEMNFFWVAIFCMVAFVLDAAKNWLFVLAVISMSLLFLAGECIFHFFESGEPFIRWKIAAAADSDITLTDARAGDGAFAFFLWPIRIALFDKQFSFLLGTSFLVGAMSYKQLTTNHKIILLSCFGYWLWLGYGTQVPWEYRPRSRAFHYHLLYVLSISTFTPLWMRYAKERYRTILVALIIVSNLTLICLGGTWGQRVDTSRLLLAHIRENPNETYLADLYTARELTTLNDFSCPSNLLVWPEKNSSNDSVLAIEHLDRTDLLAPPEYLGYIRQGGGEVEFTVQPRLRMLFAPFAKWIPEKQWIYRARGANVTRIKTSMQQRN